MHQETLKNLFFKNHVYEHKMYILGCKIILLRDALNFNLPNTTENAIQWHCIKTLLINEKKIVQIKSPIKINVPRATVSHTFKHGYVLVDKQK